MTFEEIERLIREYGHHALSYGDSSDVDELLAMNSSRESLLEAIKQYGKQENTVRDEFDEVSDVKLSPPTEHVE